MALCVGSAGTTAMAMWSMSLPLLGFGYTFRHDVQVASSMRNIYYFNFSFLPCFWWCRSAALYCMHTYASTAIKDLPVLLGPLIPHLAFELGNRQWFKKFRMHDCRLAICVCTYMCVWGRDPWLRKGWRTMKRLHWTNVGISSDSRKCISAVFSAFWTCCDEAFFMYQVAT